ncbi:ABC transporter ATP-binding protein (plasmid) [Rhizobium ruizarguesonis]|jgi:peptide/nickel transport system ATP-binding protein|uniref:ABC transporter ATP-binding protein n=1 Tax=Rhizobium ruizarguesonis TaxID=2081791 RepID=UPI001030473E|nr:ABC transporter ATP-binding protein [Rhizobium ruizarguesonis]NKL43740.1 nickel ABC transporter ATP-binding protein NikE [Rhizobium leguminosarum bv. viciae]NEH61271.1 nickel ABC transporter ATP-binding protein NikE [Rhizobium ruizarguesonis]NEI80676.1 nickel ABC transporter ATP-binding protein NikE [Rhizobium ruizarguesonis]NKQ86151.1 ABC transporter [Rhizobium ruizarguesonis]TAT93704.1 ABC transporter ATP-binding protein [Rhizobium ruizarguesonis]
MSNFIEIRDLKVEATTDSGRRVEIIKGVSLDVAEGEIVALIGESGSGKTTIALTLMGHTRAGCRISGGSVSVGGKDMVTLSEKQRAKVRGTEVAYVPQSAAAAFNPATSIMDQVIEVTRIHQLMSPDEARARAVELFRALSLPEPETIGSRYPHQVSGGQLQRLAAAMALIGDPTLVIFDEPTTALDVTTQIEVLRAFKSVMKKGGISGVYVSHDLAVVAQIADRIVVLKGGETQETGTTEEILNNAKHPYTRELLAAFEPKPRGAVGPAEPATAPLLRIEDLVAGYGQRQADGLPLVRAVEHVSLKVEKGRNLGIIGESGCGKSTLARAIAGILPASVGSIVFNGTELRRSARERSRDQLREMQIVFQYADTALNPAKSVEDILDRPLVFYHGMDRKARNTRIDQLLDMVRLPRNLRHRRPGELSGGQKQRVNFARALAADPKLILCDEITSALDTVVAAAVIDLLKELQRELGLSYIFISHDLSVVEAICDEIVVMFGGRKVEEITSSTVKAPQHPYSQLLFSSVPTLDPAWLDGLQQDPELVRAYCRH